MLRERAVQRWLADAWPKPIARADWDRGASSFAYIARGCTFVSRCCCAAEVAPEEDIEQPKGPKTGTVAVAWQRGADSRAMAPTSTRPFMPVPCSGLSRKRDDARVPALARLDCPHTDTAVHRQACLTYA